jgi:hypothetical protein
VENTFNLCRSITLLQSSERRFITQLTISPNPQEIPERLIYPLLPLSLSGSLNNITPQDKNERIVPLLKNFPGVVSHFAVCLFTGADEEARSGRSGENQKQK